MLTFYSNGNYIQYQVACDSPSDSNNLEIGTYTLTGNSLSIDSHIVNGCGGFDDDNNSDIPPASPPEVSFNQDGSSLTLVPYNITGTSVE
jgi:hypothetical protein